MSMLISGGINSSDMHSIPERVKRLEDLGWNSVSVGETSHNPFLPLVLVAEHTREMQFATSVAIAFPRVPHISANLGWDLSKYSGGRFVLGLGTQVKGHNERRFSVPWAPPGPHLRDYIRCVRAIWDSWQNGTRPDYEGEYYQYKLTSPFFNPGPIEHPDIKIIVSAVNPFNARLAGEVADGLAIPRLQHVPVHPRGVDPRRARRRAARWQEPGRPADPWRRDARHRPQRGGGPGRTRGDPSPDLLLRFDAVLLKRPQACTAGTMKPPTCTACRSMANGTKWSAL